MARSGPGAADARWAGEAPLRVLVGPYILAEHCAYMDGAFDDFDVVTFGAWEGADLRIEGLYSLPTLLDRLPEGWRPDLMVLWRPEYTSMPRGLEEAPFPVAMMISDWYLAFTECLEAARFVNAVITGTRGLQAYQAAGFDHVLAMPMLGYQEGFDGIHARRNRSIDVLCAGNPNWSVHRERERVVARLLELPPRVRFVHSPMVSRHDYNRLLGNAKIFVNHTVIGELNMKCYEVPSAGTCLFVEKDNLDIRGALVPGESVVLYDRDDLNEKILYYLDHEEERASIAREGQRQMRARSYRANMRGILERLRGLGRDRLLGMGREIRHADAATRQAHYLGYAARHTGYGLDEALELAADLPGSLGRRRTLLEGVLQYTAASAPFDQRHGRPWRGVWEMERVLETLREAWEADPDDLCLNLAWAQMAREHADPATTRRALERLVTQLEEGCRVPLGGTNLYTLNQQRRFVFERVAWEQVERGVPPDAALRGILLEFAYDLRSQLEMEEGHPLRAIDDLLRARDAHPRGTLTRPKLFDLLVRYDRRPQALQIGREHLEHCPLDNAIRLRLFECELRLGRRKDAEEHLAQARRIAAVFCDEDLVGRIDLIARRTGIALPSEAGLQTA